MSRCKEEFGKIGGGLLKRSFVERVSMGRLLFCEIFQYSVVTEIYIDIMLRIDYYVGKENGTDNTGNAEGGNADGFFAERSNL